MRNVEDIESKVRAYLREWGYNPYTTSQWFMRAAPFIQR